MNFFYVYAYSWTPGFCYHNSYPGCLQSQEYWKRNFTIHGLWPQFWGSGYPSYCTNETFNVENVEWNPMIQRFPNVKYIETDPEYTSFWNHEWTKHGTCSGLSQQNYFQECLRLTDILLTPEILTPSVLEADLLREALGGNVALQCNNQILTGVYSCWQCDGNGFPTTQIDCPAEILHEDTCRKSENITVLGL